MIDDTKLVNDPLDSSSPTRPRFVPWSTYYLVHPDPSHHQPLPFQSEAQPHGLLACPVCRHHLPNIAFIDHVQFHLKLDLLEQGSVALIQQLCPLCLHQHQSSSSNTYPSLDCVQAHRHLSTIPSPALSNSLDACSSSTHPICPLCELSLPNKVSFARHLFKCHVKSEAPFTCKVCYQFHSSHYPDLVSHFTNHHSNYNQIYCPYCLKFFELLPSIDSAKSVFTNLIPRDWSIFPTSHAFFDHLSEHWDTSRRPFKCQFCRLTFVECWQRRLHEYLDHSSLTSSLSHPPCDKSGTSCASQNTMSSSFHSSGSNSSSPSGDRKLSLCYLNHLESPEVDVKSQCLECGEKLTKPFSDHFTLTLKCSVCEYSSSCSVAVSHHWSRIHRAPPIPHKALDAPDDLISWESSIRRRPKLQPTLDDPSSGSRIVTTPNSKYSKADYNASFDHYSVYEIDASRTNRIGTKFDFCGSKTTHPHKEACPMGRHAPCGYEVKGLLRCQACPFKSIIGNQMARHLTTQHDDSVGVRIDRRRRVKEFRIVRRKRRNLKTALWWQSRFNQSSGDKNVEHLFSVGLISRTLVK